MPYNDTYTTRGQWWRAVFSGLIAYAVIGTLAALLYDPKLAFIVFTSAPILVLICAGPRPPKKEGSENDK